MTSQAAFGPPFFPGASAHPRTGTLLILAMLGACTTQRGYEGAPLPASEVAVVRADPVLSAGSPVQVRLRQVDGRDVGLSATKVEVPAGRHSLLVDCRVAESGSVRRFTVEARLEGGARYRLVASASARNCEAVELIAD